MEDATRHYKGKDVDMLTVLSTIITNAQANQPILEKKRSNLSAAYLTYLETRLNAVIQTNLGIDNAKQLREQTQMVYSTEQSAYQALSAIKKQIESSYISNKSRLKELLTQLGYNSYFNDAQNKDTEAIISLLYQYQQNITPQLQNELTAIGIPKNDVTDPLNYADTLRAVNVSQKSFKDTRKITTAIQVQSYNDIYDEVTRKVCKLASLFFPANKPQQQLFSYSFILKTMNNNSDKTATTPPVPATPK